MTLNVYGDVVLGLHLLLQINFLQYSLVENIIASENWTVPLYVCIQHSIVVINICVPMKEYG